MSKRSALELARLSDAQAAAILFAIDPHGLGGITVRASASPARDHWLKQVRALMPASAPWRRLPPGVADVRLDGGLDIAATLSSGRPVFETGLLVASDGGTLVLPMAERLPEPAAARLAAALDTGQGQPGGPSARFGVIALDEGLDDAGVSVRLRDRLAFWVDLSDYDISQPWPEPAGMIELAQAKTSSMPVPDPLRQALAATAASLGVRSLNPLILAQRVARTAASLAGRDTVVEEDAALAARLVLAPRALQLPVEPDAQANQQTARKNDPHAAEEREHDRPEKAAGDEEIADRVLAAAKSALPPGLLLKLQVDSQRTPRATPGRAGAIQASPKRGRPAGVRARSARGEARLNIIETLRAAAPWQRLRRVHEATVGREQSRIAIRRDDFRFTRFKQRTETVTLFVVDASGSLASNRLAEAKGAVELLLAECYVRRDQVALLAFRGLGVELVLPPTRSLARAKRSLAALAGGGATPLAGAIDAAVATAELVRRQGRTPVIVFLTDGRANVARDGTVGRAVAEADAQSAARAAGRAGIRMLVVDAAVRAQPHARALAAGLGATYVPLPRIEAETLTAAVRTMTLA